MAGNWDRPPWEDDPLQNRWVRDKFAQEIIEQELAYRQDRQMMQDEFSRLISKGTRTQSNGKGVFTRFSLPAPPKVEILIIQFIGGPKNGEQEYVDPKASQRYSQGAEFIATVRNDLPDGTTVFENFRYKATHIPMAETPFATNAQIVIALFQEG